MILFIHSVRNEVHSFIIGFKETLIFVLQTTEQPEKSAEFQETVFEDNCLPTHHTTFHNNSFCAVFKTASNLLKYSPKIRNKT